MGIISKAKKVKRFWSLERRWDVKPDPTMLRHGFLSYRRNYYSFETIDKAFFITDWEVEFNFRTLNNRTAQENLKNKAFVQLMLRHSPLGKMTPGLIGLVVDGKYRSLSEFSSVEDIFGYKERVFVKPAAAWAGDRCSIATNSGQIPSTGTYVLENCAEAHPYALKIFPDSINTIRLVTLKDDNNNPFIMGAAHRFGGQVNSPIDNLSKGGVTCGIDMDTGILGSGASNFGAHSTIFHDLHPVTKAELVGVQIPFWEEVKQLALDLSSYFNDLNYCGWDIYVSPEGPKLIEGNAGLPHPDLIQVHSPMLASRRVRKRLCEFGMISKKKKDYIDLLCETTYKALDRP